MTDRETAAAVKLARTRHRRPRTMLVEVRVRPQGGHVVEFCDGVRMLVAGGTVHALAAADDMEAPR